MDFLVASDFRALRLTMAPPRDESPERLSDQMTGGGEPVETAGRSLGDPETDGVGPPTDSFGPLFDESWSPPPVLAGRYRMEERIGRDGMGVVYLAHDTHLDLKIAVKLISRGSDRAVTAPEQL